MEVPPQITFRDDTRTDSLEALIREKIDRLDRISDKITSCRVVVEKPHESPRQGNPHRVRIEVKHPPGHDIIVKRDPGEGNMHDPLDRVIRDAFDVVERKLRELREKMRGEVKKHPDQELGALVEKLFPDEGYGFLRTVEGDEVYFHKNSVLNDDFERLELGTGVRFVLEMGEEGYQASTVSIVSKPGSRMGQAAGEPFEE